MFFVGFAGFVVHNMEGCGVEKFDFVDGACEWYAVVFDGVYVCFEVDVFATGSELLEEVLG